MNDYSIILIALFFIYFHIGGLSTTNILRLTKGNTLPILSSKCVCDGCGATIPPLLQLPIVSYIVCRGKCKQCGGKIPLYPLFLEIAILVGMFTISCLFNVSVTGVLLSYAYYEIVRIIAILLLGKREKAFAKNYGIAVLSMIPFLLLTIFVAWIASAL